MATNRIVTELSIEEKKALASLSKVIKQLDGFEKKADNAAKKASKSFGSLQKSISAGASKTNQAFATFTGFIGAKALIGSLGLLKSAFTSTFSAAIGGATSFEKVVAQFTTLTGSAGEAQKTIEDLKTFALDTPFEFKELAPTAAKLLAFGVTTEELVPLLGELGDVAAGSGAAIGEIGLIFGQVAAAGKLTGERLLQLEERAIPIGPAIAKSMGVAEKSVRQLVTDGKVSFEEFQKAFQTLNDEGNQFFEGAIRQAKTFGEISESLEEIIEASFTEIGKAILPVAKIIAIELIGSFSDLRKTLVENQAVIKRFVEDSFIKMADATILVLDSLDTLQRAFEVTFNSLKVVGAVASLGIVRALQGIVFAFKEVSSALGREQPEAELAFEALAQSAVDAEKIIDESMLKIGSAFERDTTAAGKAADFLKGKVKSLRDAVVESQQSAGLGALREFENKPAAKEKVVIDPETTPEVILERQKIALLTQLKEEQKLLESEQKAVKDEQFTLDGEAELENLQRQKDLQTQIEANAQATKTANELKTNQDLLGLQRKFEKESIDSQIKTNQKKAKDDKDAAQKKKEMGELIQMTAQGFLSAGIALAKQGSREQKALQTTQAIVSTYTAAAKALAFGPGPPFTLPLVAATIAQGFAQVRNINAQKFADGGIVGGNSFSGDRVPALVNSGEVVLNKTAQRNLVAGSVGGGDAIVQRIAMLEQAILSQPIEVNVDGQMIAKAVRNAQQDGFGLL